MSMYTWRDIPEDLHRKLSGVAKLRGISMSTIIEIAVREYIAKLETKVMANIASEGSNDGDS